MDLCNQAPLNLAHNSGAKASYIQIARDDL